VLLITSRGPEMVVIPNVVNMTWDKAKAALLAAGFTTLVYDHSADSPGVPAIIRVSKVTPAPGTSVVKGTTLKVSFS
jgi:eukaryotic-like serine/threonine-protein kinase